MDSILRDAVVQPHLTNLDVPKRQAKVHTVAHKKVAMAEARGVLARWIDRARALSRLTADQFADAVGCHPSQLSKWISAAEPPQVDRVLLSPMRRFMLQAIAEDTPGCEVQTLISVKRSA